MKSRHIIYLVLVGLSVMIYMSWVIGILPAAFQRFMSYYGLHALGPFALAITCISWNVWMSKGHAARRTFKKFCIFWNCGMTLLLTFHELSQLAMPDRVFDPYDILAQMIGLILGTAIVAALEWKTLKS